MRFTPSVVLVLVAVAPWATGCLEPPAVPANLRITCVAGDDCPDDTVCVGSPGLCLPGDDPCLDVDDASRTAVVRADGAACGDGRLCLDAGCVASVCGDGLTDLATGEACDDGNDVDDDTCTNACTVPRCGDGIVQIGEACDDTNLDSGDGCRNDCRKVEVCGDGLLDEGEACDDGATAADGTVVPDPNPIDGCDACALQAFTPELAVSSTIAPDASVLSLRTIGLMAVDDVGRVLFADPLGNRVLRREPDGSIVPIAGTGDKGDGGDGGLATLATFDAPFGIAVDARRRRIYVTDANNGLVRAIEGDGRIRTFAGTRDAAAVDDDSRRPATSAPLTFPTALLLDARGNLIIVEQGGGRLRQVDVVTGLIDTIAGAVPGVDDGTVCSSGSECDGGVCFDGRCGLVEFLPGHCFNEAPVVCTDNGPCGPIPNVCVDDDGPLGDPGRCGVKAAGPEDCGPGRTFEAGEPRLATEARLAVPTAAAFDGEGRLLFTDFVNHVIYRRQPDGSIEIIAGTRRANGGFAGDGGPSRRARINGPAGLLVKDGVLFVAEEGNHVVRTVDLDTLTIGTFAGSAPVESPTGPTDPCRFRLDEFHIDNFGGGCVVLDPGDDDGRLNSPLALVQAGDELFISERGSSRVRSVALPDPLPTPLTAGPITTFIGTPPSRQLPDSQALSTFGLTSPGPIAVDSDGRVVFVDLGLDAVLGIGPGPSLVPGPTVFGPQLLRVDTDGVLRRIAGTGVAGTGGDNGPSRLAPLTAPGKLLARADGALFLLDNQQVRRVDAAGIITTLALPTDVSGVAAVAIDGDRVLAIDTDSSRVLQVGDGAAVLIPADSDDLTFFIDVSTTSDGIVVVTEVVFVDVDFTTFAIRLHRLQGQSLSPLAFDTSALVPFVENTFTVPGVFDHDDTGFSIVLPDHAGARLVRLHDDGSVTTIAGNGLEGCAPGLPGPACDRTFDGATTVDDAVAPPAPELTTDDVPLRLVHRLNLTFPGIDDLDPATPTPRRSAQQRVAPLSQVARGADGSLYFGEQPTVAIERKSNQQLAPLADNAARVRRLRPDGRLETVVGPVHPIGPGFRFLDAVRLYHPKTLARIGPADILAAGAFGRVVRIDDPSVAVVVGIDTDLPPVLTVTPGLDLPLFDGGPRGLAVDGNATHLVITAGTGQPGTGTITTLALGDVFDPRTWTVTRIDTGLVLPAGVAFDIVANRFLIVDEGDACVRAFHLDTGLDDAAVAGTCGEAGSVGAFLQDPTNVVVDDTGRLFVSDTGNHRVVRFDDATTATVILGDGSRSVAGEGKPARAFPIDSPGQLGIDPFGNLYVTSPTVVREVTNILDDNPDNDAVITIYGKNRQTFPESSSFCLSGLTIDEDHVSVADACQDFLVTLHSGH